jgi:hypothetical protein
MGCGRGWFKFNIEEDSDLEELKGSFYISPATFRVAAAFELRLRNLFLFLVLLVLLFFILILILILILSPVYIRQHPVESSLG